MVKRKTDVNESFDALYHAIRDAETLLDHARRESAGALPWLPSESFLVIPGPVGESTCFLLRLSRGQVLLRVFRRHSYARRDPEVLGPCRAGRQARDRVFCEQHRIPP